MGGDDGMVPADPPDMAPAGRHSPVRWTPLVFVIHLLTGGDRRETASLGRRVVGAVCGYVVGPMFRLEVLCNRIL